ncbi:MAG: nucleotidyltransferase domain-containing protein [Candidatus Methanolliviera hydrocarbonicum]|jgi:Predicted nucleotidyltransferases|uniref:Nucleotidyltransferase domain-containing protein n=1 Tax=Candidatus Methanolliviera hydrocarbonicum TaxID=2491085 RepID=A0A520KWN5_9EURY|nr:MAG: nucleotidyltransferase domain-containing protein [Candidatus Methanolliviera hydrocarbonicum]
MRKLCRIDIGRREEILEEVKNFAGELKEKFGCKVYLYGSFARGEIHEGSDIDLMIIGDFKERFFERIGKILEMTDLPIEPLVYSIKEFEGMREENSFIKEVMREAVRL